MKSKTATKQATKNTGGWKICTRRHKYRGKGPCPVCYPGNAKKD